jgi:hypothetical protein
MGEPITKGRTMLKQNYSLEVEKDNKVFKFEFQQDATLGVLFDVLCEMRGYIMDRISVINKEAEEQKKEQEEVASEEKDNGSTNT